MAGSESFLQYRYRNSTQPPAVFSNTNGLLEQIGNSFGQDWFDELVGDVNSLRHMNLVVEWEGELYAVTRNVTNFLAIFKYNSSTGIWSQDTVDLVNLAGVAQLAVNLGLHPVEIDGIPYLYFIYHGAGDTSNRSWSHIRKQSRFKGDGSWSTALAQTLESNTGDSETDERGVYGDILIDENILYTSLVRGIASQSITAPSRAGSIGALSLFNFKTRIWSGLPQAGASGYEVGTQGQASLTGPMALAKFKGKIYQLAREGSSEHSTPFRGSNILIQSFTKGIIGGNIEQILIGDLDQIESSDPDVLGAQNWEEGRYCMFVDRSLDKLFAIAYIRGSGAEGGPAGIGGRAEDGWACWQLDQDGAGDLINEGEISHTVLPEAVRAGISTRVGNPAQSLRWTSYDIVDASGNTEILLELAGGGGTSDLVNTYKWRGPSLEIEFLGQGGGGDLSIPLINGGGGEGIFSDRHPFDVVVGTDPSGGQGVGEVTLTARVIGSGEPIDIRWFHASNSGDIPNLICTIKDASSGSISSNVLTGAVADSGIEYSVTWEAATDGVPANSFFAVKSSAVIV